MEIADHEIKEATKQIAQTDKDLNGAREYVTTLTKGRDNEEIQAANTRIGELEQQKEW
jgi:ribosome-binding factor A